MEFRSRSSLRILSKEPNEADAHIGVRSEKKFRVSLRSFEEQKNYLVLSSCRPDWRSLLRAGMLGWEWIGLRLIKII